MLGAFALLIAHVGHWAFYVIYAVPVVVVLASVVASIRRERRLDADAES